MLSYAHLSSIYLFSPSWPLQSVRYHSISCPTTPRPISLYSMTNRVLCCSWSSIFASYMFHWCIRSAYFSSASHAWTSAPVMFTWQCLFNDTAYNVHNILLLPEATVQLTLDDNTAVHFPYRSAQWTEFTLHLYHRTTPPTTNRWDQIRYSILRKHLLTLYKAPRNFLRAAATQSDRVAPVSAPPVHGRPG